MNMLTVLFLLRESCKIQALAVSRVYLKQTHIPRLLFLFMFFRRMCINCRHLIVLPILPRKSFVKTKFVLFKIYLIQIYSLFVKPMRSVTINSRVEL